MAFTNEMTDGALYSIMCLFAVVFFAEVAWGYVLVYYSKNHGQCPASPTLPGFMSVFGGLLVADALLWLWLLSRSTPEQKARTRAFKEGVTTVAAILGGFMVADVLFSCHDCNGLVWPTNISSVANTTNSTLQHLGPTGCDANLYRVAHVSVLALCGIISVSAIVFGVLLAQSDGDGGGGRSRVTERATRVELAERRAPLSVSSGDVVSAGTRNYEDGDDSAPLV
eukprot:m.422557 g.422557  ORF g.422557 m.422557 type:complete len:225 (+) comp37948_c0_seq1:65-739(+)